MQLIAQINQGTIVSVSKTIVQRTLLLTDTGHPLSVKSLHSPMIHVFCSSRRRYVGNCSKKRQKRNIFRPLVAGYKLTKATLLSEEWAHGILCVHSSLCMTVWLNLSMRWSFLITYIHPYMQIVFPWWCWYLPRWQCNVSYSLNCAWVVRRAWEKALVISRT